MIDLAEAQRRVLALGRPVMIETVPLLNAHGRWSAEKMVAKRSQPTRDVSAMDGYAVRSQDGISVRTVIGESSAGAAFRGLVGAGQAVRIFTGAVLPDGADAVIIQENVDRQGESIRVLPDTNISPIANIRPRGSDFSEDDLLVPAGVSLNPVYIGLLAAGGHAAIAVRRRIKVALLSTGNELAPVGTVTDDDHLPASNAVMLSALLQDLPVDILDMGIAGDTQSALRTAIAQASDADILVTIGGASVGDYDLVQPVFREMGAEIDFWKVAMRPGKPLIAGTLGPQILLGLPGNPVSAYVTALLFLKPLVAHLSGAIDPVPVRVRLPLNAEMAANGARTDHVRAILENGRVIPLLRQDSAGLKALSCAQGLIVRAPHAPTAAKGDQVDVILM